MKTIFRLCGALTLLGAAFVASANEGRIVFLDGAVRIVRLNMAPVEARLGDTFGAGASILTGAGRAHVRFSDGALLTLQPNTNFAVSTYVFNGRNDGAEQFAGSLLKGAVRMVTGLVGRRESRVFRIEGVVATVGIRGTAFKMEYCNKDCGGRADGLYVDGGEGTTVVSNAAGSVDLTRGGSAFVANPQSAPERTSQRTSVAAPAPPRSPAQLVGAVREEQRFADYSFKTGNLEPPFRNINITQAGGAFAGMEQVAGAGEIGSASGGTGAGETLTVVLDAASRVFAIGGTGSNESFFLTINNVENAGTDGLLYWGRWANGQVQANSNSQGKSSIGTIDLAGTNSIHYIVSQQASMIPTGGTATYTFFSTTPSTSNDGMLGAGVTSGTFTANFGSLTSSTLAMSVSHGGITLNQNGAITLTRDNRAAFSGTGGGSFPFTFEGFFGGGNRADANPARVGIAYQIQRPGNYINGVAGFK